MGCQKFHRKRSVSVRSKRNCHFLGISQRLAEREGSIRSGWVSWDMKLHALKRGVRELGQDEIPLAACRRGSGLASLGLGESSIRCPPTDTRPDESGKLEGAAKVRNSGGPSTIQGKWKSDLQLWAWKFTYSFTKSLGRCQFFRPGTQREMEKAASAFSLPADLSAPPSSMDRMVQSVPGPLRNSPVTTFGSLGSRAKYQGALLPV
ncbi:hypothetical protein VTK26DRAFT_5984 [Humicola hyalothermophila]